MAGVGVQDRFPGSDACRPGPDPRALPLHLITHPLQLLRSRWNLSAGTHTEPSLFLSNWLTKMYFLLPWTAAQLQNEDNKNDGQEMKTHFYRYK